MPTLDEIEDYCQETESGALKIDGHDNAILGAGYLGPDGEYVLVYSEQRILGNLVWIDKMDPTEAIEYFEFNIKGAHMGPGTPIIIDERNEGQCIHGKDLNDYCEPCGRINGGD